MRAVFVAAASARLFSLPRLAPRPAARTVAWAPSAKPAALGSPTYLLAPAAAATAWSPAVWFFGGVAAAALARPLALAATEASEATAHLNEPAARDARYGRPLNAAQYLVDLHDARAVFDFCGGMPFQLVLSKKLRAHLAEVAKAGDAQPVEVFDAATDRLAKIPGYSRAADADNARVFHGREVRQVPDAAGGKGFVLQLSFAGDDPEGWTQEEIGEYDGWGHDSTRTWRNGERLESEGVGDFRRTFGNEAFTLHHRFYLHFDRENQLWLSAEDGCEGTPWRGGSAQKKFLFF